MEAVKKYDIKEITIRLNNLRKKFGSYEVDREINFQSKYTNNWCDNLNLAYRVLKNRHTKIYRSRFGFVRPITYEIKQRSKLWTEGNWFVPVREVSDVGYVIVGLDMTAGAGNGHAVQELKKVEVQCAKQAVRRALCRIKLTPGIERPLCLTENLVDRLAGIQFSVNQLCVSFIGQRQLIAQIIEAVINRSGGEHQYLGLDACADHFLHQGFIAIVTLSLVHTDAAGAVAEVVGLVDDHQIIVAPVEAIQIQAVGLTVRPGKVCMKQHIIVKPVSCNRIVDIVILIGIPVLRQPLGAQHKNRFVPVFIVFNHGQRSESLAQTDAIRQDAAVILFQLIDDGQHRIPLEVVQHAPDLALLEACCLIWQDILGDVLQELAEDIVQCNEVNHFRRVFVERSRDVFNDGFRHILQLIPVIPDGVEQLHIGLRHRSVIHAVDHIVHIVTAFASQVDRCKSGNRHVDDLLLTAGNRHKRTHVVSGNIGFEFCLSANPVSALLSNRLLGHLIAQLDLKLRAIKTLLPAQTRNIEFPALLGFLLPDEGRRRKDKPKLVHVFQLLLQFPVGIHGEVRSGDGNLIAPMNSLR